MNKKQAEEKASAMKAKLSQYTSDDLHPVLALCIEARRLRELHQELVAYNDEMDQTGGWRVFNDPDRMRSESLAYEAEVRMEWILAEDRYNRAAAEDDELYDDYIATREAGRP